MSKYFKNNYSEINYPIENNDNPGLRNAQLGAIHSISSFFTLNKTKPAIIVMPTGSGKTAVLTMVPFVVKSKKILVVTPAKMVRQQITEEFSLLKTLHKAEVFKDMISKPEVYEMKHKIESIYEKIIESFAGEYKKISRYQMHRVLANLKSHEMFNTGMQHRFNESGESYRITSGSNTSQNIAPSTGKMYSAGHVFCKAIFEGKEITIGYSSGSKIWSSSYGNLREFVNWCNLNGKKIFDSEVEVKTNTNFDYLPVPKKLDEYPDNIFLASFSGEVYTDSYPIYSSEDDEKIGLIVDLNILKPKVNSENEIEVEFKLEEYRQKVKCNLEGVYSSSESKIYVRAGRNEIDLADYLNDYPLIFKTTDDKMITGDEITVGDPDTISFSADSIKAIDWKDHNTDISSEVEAEEGINSIQDTLKEILLEDDIYKYVIFDHTTGEIADFIAVEEREDKFKLSLFHVKSKSGVNYNSSTADVYEVSGQAVKSVIWLKSKSILLDKIKQRRRSEHCQFIQGDYDDFREQFRTADKTFRAKIVMVQPAISKSQEMLFKIQEVLAASEYYIKRGGKVNDFEIWGSE